MRSLLLLHVFCWSSQACKTSQHKPQPGNVQQSLQSGQQQFTNRLLQQIESNTTTNFVLSPHSIHSVFSQLLQGSGGRTKAELENLLGVTASDSLVEQYRILGESLSGEGFNQANLLALADSFKPKHEYRTSLKNGFQSDIRAFNFGSKPQKSVQEINRFVEDATGQKIKDLLENDDVDGDTRMVLVNAVYFKAHWQFAFNVHLTYSGKFKLTKGHSIDAQFMRKISDVRVLDDTRRKLRILELPYEHPNRSMLMFKTDLKEHMVQLGVRDLFSEASADLSGISNEHLFASKGVHQALIEVNEEGTEAAAATAAIVGQESAPPRWFIADRPFLFIVYDFEHKTTLFAGKVADPNNAGVVQS